MAEKEGYSEDVVALHNSDASQSGNKFDIGFGDPGSPGIQTTFPASPTFGENDFPRQTGSDSLVGEEELLT